MAFGGGCLLPLGGRGRGRTGLHLPPGHLPLALGLSLLDGVEDLHVSHGLLHLEALFYHWRGWGNSGWGRMESLFFLLWWTFSLSTSLLRLLPSL